MANLVLGNKFDLNRNLFWVFCIIDLLCIFVTLFFKFFLLPILILFGLTFLLSLCFKSGIKFNAFLMLLFIYTAPLERIRWDVGFALRPIIVISLLGFYILLIEFLVREFKIDLRTKQLFILCFLLVGAFILSSIASLDPIKSIRVTILYITLFILLFLIIKLVESKAQFTLYLKHYMIVGLLISLYGVSQLVGFWFGFNPDVLVLSKFSGGEFRMISPAILNSIGFRINSLFTIVITSPVI